MKDSDWRDLIQTLTGQGWRVEHTRRGHIQLIPPKGDIVVIASTPSDHRAIKNTRARCRRSGAVL